MSKKIDQNLLDKAIALLVVKYGNNRMIGKKTLRVAAIIAVREGWFTPEALAGFDTTRTKLEDDLE